jgi:phosphoglycolate phosphatase-like HAD superfamily hydrolase
MTQLVVFDYDGTLTDLNKGSVNFVKNYKSEVRGILGVDEDSFNQNWFIVRDSLFARPENYGWEINGKISVPLFADSILEVQTIAVELYRKKGLSAQETEKHFWDVYAHNVSSLENCPAEGLESFLDSFAMFGVESCIVTNSSTESVSKKIKGVKYLENFQLFGGAKKFNLDESIDRVPVCEQISGRNVYLRRPNYLKVIDELSQSKNVPFSDMVFVGDIYDFDLALPRALGASVIYLPGSMVPKKEIDYISNLDRATVCSNLEEVAIALSSK